MKMKSEKYEKTMIRKVLKK